MDRKSQRRGVAEAFTFDASVSSSVEANLTLVSDYDDVLAKLELDIKRHVAEHEPRQCYLLRTIPGIGPLLALNIIYEVGDINRFERVSEFASYARLKS